MKQTQQPPQYNEQRHKQHLMVGSLMVLLSAITVSSKAILVKLAYAYPVNAETLIALRMLFSLPFFAGLAIWVIWKAPNRRALMSKRDAWMIAAAGIVGGYGPMWLDFAGLDYVTAGLERIILYVYPTIVLLLSAYLFGRRIGKREVFAVIVSYIGVALAVGHDISSLQHDMHDTWLGIALVFASALVYAAYVVYGGRVIPRVGPMLYTAYSMLMATVASGAHYLSTHPLMALTHIPHQVYVICLIMAIVATVLPAVLLNAGIQRIGSNHASLISSIGPISTIYLAYLFLGESVSWMQMLGTGFVVLGIFVISLKPKHG